MQKPHSLQPTELHHRFGAVSRKRTCSPHLDTATKFNSPDNKSIEISSFKNLTKVRSPDQAGDTFNSEIKSLSYIIHTCAD